MAAKANQQTEAEMQPQDSAAEAQDNDAAQQTLKTLMRLGKERGYVTHDEVNDLLRRRRMAVQRRRRPVYLRDRRRGL